MDFDQTKFFMYMEDNGDGTTTMVISIPEVKVFETAVMGLSLLDAVTHMMQDVTPETSQGIMDNITVIPDSLED